MATPEVATGSGREGEGRPWRLPLLFVGLAFLAASTVFPWWTLAATSGSGSAAFEFGLTSLCVRPSSACTAYGPLVAADPGYRAIADGFGVAASLASLGLLAAFLALLLRLAGERRPLAVRASPILGFVSGIFALAAPVYLLAALPGTFAGSTLPSASLLTGFFGGVSGSGVTLQWGGSLGWALSLLASPLLVVASGFRPLPRRLRSPAPVS